MSKFIVTGGTGFIGSTLCKKLVNENHEVYVICRENSSIKRLENIKDKIHIFTEDNNIDDLIEIFNKVKPDCVFHTAGLIKSEHNPQDILNLLDSNIYSTAKILEAMRESKTNKIINTSTCLKHFNNENYNPSCLYAATKKASEDIIKYYSEAYNIKALTLTLFNIYGENDNENRLLNTLNRISNTDIEYEMSDGYQLIDLTYVDDVIDAYIHAYDIIKLDNYSNNNCFAVCSERLVTLRELVQIFESENNVKINIKWGAKEYRQREIFNPWSNYTLLPGWHSKITLEEGVKKFGIKY